MRSSNSGVDRASVPSRLESAQAKLVYLALAVDGPATADTLAARLNETRLALLAVLTALEKQGLVAREAEGYALV
jgi:predicted Rossmann fold nucleotide-binding protein DprA/Smf involved in DNA uptake